MARDKKRRRDRDRERERDAVIQDGGGAKGTHSASQLGRRGHQETHFHAISSTIFEAKLIRWGLWKVVKGRSARGGGSPVQNEEPRCKHTHTTGANEKHTHTFVFGACVYAGSRTRSLDTNVDR